MSNQTQFLNRRSFLRNTSAAVVLPIVSADVLNLLLGERIAVGSWKTVIVPDGEAGKPLIVSGTIYAPDGRTPLEGITLFVYQTDATGVYSTRASNGDHRNTRLHGEMRTNSEGRYEFRTIKPGSYPQSTNPAHIHAYISGPGYPEYWIDEYLFDDDRFVAAEERQKASAQGTFSPVLKLVRGSDGVLRGVRDIKVERCSRNCTGK